MRLSFDLDLYNIPHMHGSAFNKGKGITLSTPFGRWRSFESFLTFLPLGTEYRFPCFEFGAVSPRSFHSYTTTDGAIIFADEAFISTSYDCIGTLCFATRRLASQRSHSTHLHFSHHPWRRILWLLRWPNLASCHTGHRRPG